MKKTAQILLVILLFGIWGALWYDYSMPLCEKGVVYGLGTVDSEFNLPAAEFASIITEAVEIWNQELGREVIRHSDQSRFQISLIFDERQAETNRRLQAQITLDEQRLDFERQLDEIEQARLQHDQAYQAYESKVRAYEADQNDYNRRVQDFNAGRGGNIQELRALESDLRSRGQVLETEREQLNNFRNDLNRKSISVNNLIAQFNEGINQFNQEFVTEEVSNQGIYSGRGIEIYQYENHDDLLAVLVHELGHALGLDHVDDERAIMYYRQHTDIRNNITLSHSDRVELARVCPAYSL